MMHRVLRIPELVAMILSHCAPSSASALARTCRSISPIALERLWTDINGEAVVELFMQQPWAILDGPFRLVEGSMLTIAAQLSQVKSLSYLKDDHLLSLMAYDDIPSFVSMFPRLKAVHLELGTALGCYAASQILVPSVRHLAITLQDSELDDPEDPPEGHAASMACFIIEIGTLLPHLQALEIIAGASLIGQSDEDVLEAILQLLQSCIHLRSLRIKVDMMCDCTGLVKQMSLLQELEDLDFAVGSDWAVDSNLHARFPRLVSLKMKKAYSADSLLELIRSIESVELRNVEIEYSSFEPTAPLCTTNLSEVIARKWTGLESFILNYSCPQLAVGTFQSQFGSLLACSSIQCFTVSWPSQLTLHDGDINEISKRWPAIRKLHIQTPGFDWHSSSWVLPCLSWSGLQCLMKSCLALESLALAVDFTTVAFPDAVLDFQTAFSTLANSDISDGSLSHARLIDALVRHSLPRIKQFSFYEPAVNLYWHYNWRDAFDAEIPHGIPEFEQTVIHCMEESRTFSVTWPFRIGERSCFTSTMDRNVHS